MKANRNSQTQTQIVKLPNRMRSLPNDCLITCNTAIQSLNLYWINPTWTSCIELIHYDLYHYWKPLSLFGTVAMLKKTKVAKKKKKSGWNRVSDKWNKEC